MPFTEISNPLQAAIDLLDQAKQFGVAHFANEEDLRYMRPEDEFQYIHSQMATSLAAEWLRTGLVRREIKKKADNRHFSAIGVEYRLELVLMTKSEFKMLREVIAALVRKEQTEKQL